MTKKKHIPELKRSSELKDPQAWWWQLVLFAAVFIMLLTVLYPMAFKGLRPGGVDVIGSKGASHQLKEYEQETGEIVLWNSKVFSGMPTYHRNGAKAFNFDTIIHFHLAEILYLNIWLYLLGFIGMFYLLRFFKLSWYASAFCALGFILIPHYMSILSIGHFQKFRPVMYMPLVTFFFLNFINKKNLLWLIGFIFSFAVQIRTHHYQVIFYQILILIFLGLFYLINLLRTGKADIALKKFLLLIPACLLIIGMVAQPVFVAGEYTPYSIRGGTGETGSTGLDSSYATSWSMHPLAVFNWTMPRFFGGTSQELYTGSKVPQLKDKMIPGYWGHMPFTQTYDYIGIIMAFLALVGLIANWKKPIIKLLSALFLLSLLLAFGRHFTAFYNLFFHYVPAFNKFRAPAMMQLVIFMLSAILAGFGLDTILKSDTKLKKTIFTVAAILIIAGLIPYLFGSSFNMIKSDDVSRYGSDSAKIIAAARLDMMQSDGIRLILYALATCLIIFACLAKKIKPLIFIALLLGLMLSDQIPYVKKAEGELSNPQLLENNHFRITNTNKILLQDESYFRVFPITENPFNSNDYSYYHNSIGGYNAAKLRIYQDIIESCLYEGDNPQFPINWNVLKMLNTKYLVSSQALPEDKLSLYYHDSAKNLFTYRTKFNARPAWFAYDYLVIPERIARLNAINDPEFDAYSTAILEEQPDFDIKPDIITGSIDVVEASYNFIEYKVTNDKPALMIASEIFYPAGWKCFVDGSEKNIYKTNHVLRSIYIDTPGEHTVRFEFQPDTYLRFLKISYIAHGIAWLLLLALAADYIRKHKKQKIT